jgi:cyanate lyase
MYPLTPHTLQINRSNEESRIVEVKIDQGECGSQSADEMAYLSRKEQTMSSPEVSTITATLLNAKKARGITFSDLEQAIGRDEVWIAAVIYRQASASADEASKLLHALGLSEDLVPELTASSVKGLGPVVPTDPLIYRFYEIMQVYGMPMKEVIHEKFGDGIMSAIDFTLDIEKEEDPKGDRVKVTMNGKFLPYKKW